MLPCNVIIQQLTGGQVEIAAVDPVASMSEIDNPALRNIANNVRAFAVRVRERTLILIRTPPGRAY